MMKRYETYKNSGEEWIGDIPEHWEVVKLSYYINVVGGSTPSSSVPEYWDGEVNWVTTDDLGKLKTKNIETTRRKITEMGLNNCSASLLPEDTVIMSSRAPIGHLGILRIEGCTNQGCKGLVPFKDNILSEFLYYFLLSSKKELESLGTGSTFMEISATKLKDFKILLPSKEEQTQIATYLDYKTGLIDAIIAQKEELIKKLKEQRQAIINEAVTKGLNPNVKLKDSGIEWLGEIPEHWEVIKLFGLCHLVRGNSSFKKDELLSNGKYVALQYGKTYKVNEVNEKYKFFVNDEFYKDSQIVNYGDTIIISTSETIEDLGHSVFYKRKDLGLLGGEQLLLKAKSNKINPKYLFYSTKVFLKDLRKNATGVKVYRFNIDDLKNVFTSVPLMLEQNSIVKHIEKKSTTIDKVVLRTQTSIKKLKEYRQSLISEAVTGKIDVRNWQAPKS